MWEDKERMKIQTEEHLKRMPRASMKHFDRSRGMCSYKYGKYNLIEDGSNKLIIFETIDDLSDAGWTID